MDDIYYCGVQFYKYADELGEKIYKFSISKELIKDVFEGSSKLQLARTLAEQDDTLASLLKELDGLGD